MSFIQLTYTFQQQKVTELETMLVAHSKQQDNSPLSTWLPPLLSAYNAVDFSLSQGDKLLYEYHHDNLRITKNSLTLYQNQLDNGLRLSLTMPPPFSLNNLGWYELIILIIGFTAIGIFVRFGYGWYSRELDGIEQLALRSKLILEGDLVQAAQVPTTVSRE